jgi:hypothetical protein
MWHRASQLGNILVPSDQRLAEDSQIASGSARTVPLMEPETSATKIDRLRRRSESIAYED